MKRIAIEISNKSFLPEAAAYKAYLNENGYCCKIIHKHCTNIEKFDAIILFHGFHPFWKKYPSIVIGEYHSLSTGRYSRIKDYLKVTLNVKSNLYIFLNEPVRMHLGFSENVNYCLRSMGYDQDLICNQSLKEYDIVYVGSYRPGLSSVIKRLSSLNLKIAVVGFSLKGVSYKNAIFFDRQDQKNTFKIMSKAKFGLNYVPDIWPWCIQDSTKVIEYCASGLGVITNRYFWVNEFENQRRAKFMTLDTLNSKDDLYEFDFVKPDVSDLEWKSLISKSGLLKKIDIIMNV